MKYFFIRLRKYLNYLILPCSCACQEPPKIAVYLQHYNLGTAESSFSLCVPRQQILLSLVRETLRENVVQKFFSKKSLTITNIIDMGEPILNEKAQSRHAHI